MRGLVVRREWRCLVCKGTQSPDYGLPARLTLDAIRQGIWIAKGWLKNPKRGRKPVIRRLWMILTPGQSYTFKWTEASILTIKGRVKVPLVYVERWHGKYKDWKVKEARLICRNGRLYLHVTVEKDIKPYRPRSVLGADINYENVTLSDGTRFENHAFRRAYGLKLHIEHLQRRHPRGWRFIPQVRLRMRMLGRRARNIVVDACRKLANEVVRRALATQSAVAVEDLRYLNAHIDPKPRSWRLRLALFAYRKLLHWIEWKARLHGVPVVKVDPRGTSSECPFCGERLRGNGYRLVGCPRCGFSGDRDLVAALNIGMRGAQAALIAPNPDEAPREDEGENFSIA
ncbi:hypothetical protein B6U99_04505 [Candidatus Geothermarchaeota archaeon ex4572_27]|nr:MAG: hypothetical protein B6U99_04505 [Candidatus Geothermarchaeota archaeon ex4572_27]